MKIAVLVLAHKDKNQLNKLIKHLAKDFDIFVHIDKKSSVKPDDIIMQNNIVVINKYVVHWGSFNQIRATLELLDIAYQKGYDRYLLISGQDIPILSNKKIHGFFTENNAEFIECTKLPTPFWTNGGIDRLSKYYFNSPEGVSGFRKYFFKFAIKIFNIFILTFKVERKLDYLFFGGSNWFNLSNYSVTQILEFIKNNPGYLHRFKYTRCADEIFFQTIIMNINLDSSIIHSSLRYIDWNTGPEFPRTLRVSDYENIIKSKMLFARKIDESVDAEISRMLYSNAQSNA